MGDTTPNMSIYVPSSGEDLFRASFKTGQDNVDDHNHEGPPTNGVQLGEAALKDGSVTPNKLSVQVRHEYNYISNIGISYASPTFSVTSADGSALTTSNRGYITFQNRNNPGQLLTLNVSSNQSFEDATGTSDIAGNLFGYASGVDVLTDITFYLYAVMNDAQDTIEFSLSLEPCLSVSPDVAKMGDPSSATADDADSMWFFNNITFGDYDGNPVRRIACFRMQKTGGAANNWTVQALTNEDGVGQCDCAGGGGGTGAVDTIGVQFVTIPGVTPVAPDTNGKIDINGNVVAHGTNTDGGGTIHPVATHSRALNEFDMDVQLPATGDLGSSSIEEVGLSSYVNEHFDLDVNAQVYIADRLRAAPLGTTLNIGVTYANPTFTVHGYDGTALSTSNPGWVVLADRNNAGRRVIIKVTANQSFQDRNGTGDMNGNLFGTTTAIAWAPTLGLPMYIYAVANDAQDTIAFCLSRVPHRNGAPATTNFAKAGSAIASTQGSFFMIDSSLTVADFDLNPASLIGSLRMNKDASDNWAVETSSGAAIGFFQETVFFELPPTQNGATARNWSSTVGGNTIPTWGNFGGNYRVQADGFCHYIWGGDSVSSAGVGTGIMRLALPLRLGIQGTATKMISNMSWRNVAATNYTTLMAYHDAINTPIFTEFVFTGTATNKLTPADFTTNRADTAISIYYPIFNS